MATISGLDAVLANFDSALQQLTDKADQAVQTAGINTEAGAKQRARVRTGRFRAGYQYSNQGVCKSQVANPVEYSIFLEMGTRKMPAYPSLWPAAMEAAQQLKDDLNNL